MLKITAEHFNRCTEGRQVSVRTKFRAGILGATLETTNMGVGALAAGAVRCVLTAYPQADIFFVDYAKIPSVQTLRIDDREIQIPVINMRFSKKFYLANNIAFLLLIALCLKFVPFKRWRLWIISKNSCLNEIQQMNVMASIAGGDSFSDIYGMERFLYVSLPQVLVHLLGKKLILLPQTLGPFRGTLSRTVARYILSRADRVYSRDYRGLSELRTLLGNARATSKFAFCYDVGFVLDPVAPDCIDFVGLISLGEPNRNLVGVNISGLLYMGGYTRDNMFGLRANYKEVILALIEFLINKKDADVLLVPHVFGTGENSEADTAACAVIYEQLKGKYPGRLGLLRGQYNQNHIKYVIGKCEFFVGSRMHACIAAVSQGVPAVSVAYSDKFRGVMETLENESLVVDARQLSLDEILETIDRAYEKRDRIRQDLQSKMPEVRQTVLNLFADSGGLVEAGALRGREIDRTTVGI